MLLDIFLLNSDCMKDLAHNTCSAWRSMLISAYSHKTINKLYKCESIFYLFTVKLLSYFSIYEKDAMIDVHNSIQHLSLHVHSGVLADGKASAVLQYWKLSGSRGCIQEALKSKSAPQRWQTHFMYSQTLAYTVTQSTCFDIVFPFTDKWCFSQTDRGFHHCHWIKGAIRANQSGKYKDWSSVRTQVLAGCVDITGEDN